MALRQAGQLVVAGQVDGVTRLAGGNSLHSRRDLAKRRRQAGSSDGSILDLYRWDGGKIVLYFYSEEELNALLARLLDEK